MEEFPDFDSFEEEMLYSSMKKIGLNPIHHYNYGTMEVDFAFPEYEVVIEVDGKQHKEGKQHLKDIRRNYLVRGDGWKVWRFGASKVRKYSDFIATKIKEKLEKKGKAKNTLEKLEDRKKLLELGLTTDIDPKYEYDLVCKAIEEEKLKLNKEQV